MGLLVTVTLLIYIYVFIRILVCITEIRLLIKTLKLQSIRSQLHSPVTHKNYRVKLHAYRHKKLITGSIMFPHTNLVAPMHSGLPRATSSRTSQLDWNYHDSKRAVSYCISETSN